MTKRRWAPVPARGAAAALGLLLAAAAGADPAGAPLAAPGACAEAREKLATPDDDVLTPEARVEADDFDVAGSPRHHFTPGDVALGPADASTAPEPPSFSRGPCDAPLADCGAGRSGVEIDEEPPGTGGFPGQDRAGE